MGGSITNRIIKYVTANHGVINNLMRAVHALAGLGALAAGAYGIHKLSHRGEGLLNLPGENIRSQAPVAVFKAPMRRSEYELEMQKEAAELARKRALDAAQHEEYKKRTRLNIHRSLEDEYKNYRARKAVAKLMDVEKNEPEHEPEHDPEEEPEHEYYSLSDINNIYDPPYYGYANISNKK